MFSFMIYGKKSLSFFGANRGLVYRRVLYGGDRGGHFGKGSDSSIYTMMPFLGGTDHTG